MGLDIDLYTSKIDIGDDNANDIIIEITGLKSISKFIGLEDTPLYYDNGKFFKVEDNKIIYTDIEWKDIKGNVDDSPEIVKVISDLVDDITDDIIDEKITLHNNNRDAHPYIQDILQDNYNSLNTKIDEVGSELSQEISHLSDNLNTEIENRETADNTLSETIQNETLARIEADSTLQNNIGTLSDNLNTEINNRTNADNLLREDINEISGNLAQEILNRQTQDGILQGNIDAEALTRQNADTVLQNNINTLSQTVTDNDTAINNKVDGINTTLTNSINSLSNTVSSNYTTLDTKIDNTKNALDSDISDLSDTVTNNYNSLDARITTNTGNIATNADNITTINSKIPNQASSSNQLADKDFVNSSIATNTANFIGTFNSVAELEAYTGTLTNNDYAFVSTTDAVGNTLYDRYKWNGSEWLFEYELNNSSFTAQQWASINSGSTIENINQIAINTNNIANLQANKQDNLTAGSNIQINNNIISATDTTYTAGTGISITNGVISNTQTSAEWGNITGSLSDQLDLQHALNNKQDVLTAGTDLEIIKGGVVDLPEGYTQVEHIILSDTYFDTGIYGGQDTKITTRFYTDSFTTMNIYGAGHSENTRSITAYLAASATSQGNWRFGARTYAFPVSRNVWHEAVQDENGVLLDGVLYPYSTVADFTTVYTLGFGNAKTATGEWGTAFNGLISQYIIEKGGDIVANYIPCKNLNGIYGFYDLVSETFKTPISGSFQGGDEVVAGTVINFTNASGYTKNIGTVTSVNNIQPDVNGNVTIPTGGTVDQTYTPTSQNAQSGIAIEGELTTHYVKSSAEDTTQGITSSIGYVSNYPVMHTTTGNYEFVITTGEGASLGAIDNTTNSTVAFGVAPNGVAMLQGAQQALLTLSSNNNLTVNGSEVILRTDIDSSLSTTSENPVQNRVIAQAIENISLAKNPNLNLIGGSLNIDSGNVSGFSTTDYLQFPFVFNFNGYTWTLEMGFTTGSDVTTQQNILDSYYGVAFAINNGKFLMALSSNGSSWDIGSSSGAYSVQANTAYSVKIAWDGSNYTSSYALDETNYTTDISIASTVIHHSTQEYVGGEPELFGSGSQHPFTGTINLNKWNLIVNGLEVWLGMDDVGLGSRANIDLSNLTEAGLAKFQAPLISGENIKTINNESILGNGNIDIEIPTNYVTTNTAQTINAKKTFTGEKAIYFKQDATTNKLGFTLYNPSDTELGAFEWRPNTVNSGALLNVNVPYTSSNYVGFRYWGTAVNVIAPKVATAGNYFIPTHITDGTNTVTASNNGTLNISSLLPDVSNFVTNSSLATTLGDYALLNSDVDFNSVNAPSLALDDSIGLSVETDTDTGDKKLIVYAPIISMGTSDYSLEFTSNGVLINGSEVATQTWVNNQGYTSNVGTVTSVNNTQPDANGNVTIPTGGTVDQTYDGNSSNAQSGVAIKNAKFIQNKTSSSLTISIGEFTNNSLQSVSIGYGSSLSNSANYSIAIGYGSYCSNPYGIAIGTWGRSTAEGAIQIGRGTNSTANSLQIGLWDGNTSNNYQLLDGTTGLIPDARISTNIARSSDIPTATSDLTNDSGFITSSAISDMQTTNNLVTSVSSSSTNNQYPSAKCVYDIIGDIETLLQAV